LLLVLDTNEYIFTFRPRKESSCENLLKKIPYLSGTFIRIPLIIEEVRHNITPEAFREFLKFINILTTVDEDIIVPFEIAFKYEAKGLKPAEKNRCLSLFFSLFFSLAVYVNSNFGLKTYPRVVFKHRFSST
jgi:hypothetical protein